MNDIDDGGRFPPTDDPETLNWRALDALNGSAFQDGGQFVDTICALLLSDADIAQEVRTELAKAMERGRSGYRLNESNSEGVPKPRLVAEGFPAAKMKRAVNDRYKWFDAGEAVFDAREAGMSGDEAILFAGKKYKLGFEAMRKYAIPFYRDFRDQLEKKDGWLSIDTAVIPIMPEYIDDLSSENEFEREIALNEISDLLKVHYIWATADMAVYGLKHPRNRDEWPW